MNAASPAMQRMLRGPVLPTLVRLATPNVLGLFAITIAIGWDGYIVGGLGADALAGVALVLPLAMLMIQMSAGSLGGATTAGVARALGAGDPAHATRLAQHALAIGLSASLLFTLLASRPGLYAAMGGQGGALAHAASYASVLFGGAAAFWSINVLAAVARGTGDMLAASLALVMTTALHLPLCPTLVFGFGPLPPLGVAGAAASTVICNALSALALLAWLSRRARPVRLVGVSWRRPQPAAFRSLLRQALPASLNPIISNGAIALATAYMGAFGSVAVAAYGVAARLEYILVPIAFGMGSALTAVVATNLGARQPARAKRLTWAGAGLVGGVTGTIGIAAAVWPQAWMALFTGDAAVQAAGSGYLRIVGACYGFFGLGMALFFASQGAGRLAWPIAASALRLAVVAVGGWLSVRLLGAPPEALYVVIALSFAALGLSLAAATHAADWGNGS